MSEPQALKLTRETDCVRTAIEVLRNLDNHPSTLPRGDAMQPTPETIKRRLIILALVGLFAVTSTAEICEVPTSHASIQEALDDPACTVIEVSPGKYEESLAILRPVGVLGTDANVVVQGQVVALGEETIVPLSNLEIESGCSGSLNSLNAQVTGDDVTVVRSSALPCTALSIEIFRDGFESGDTSAWS